MRPDSIGTLARTRPSASGSDSVNLARLAAIRPSRNSSATPSLDSLTWAVSR